MSDPVKVLLLACDPVEHGVPLRLDREARAVTNAIRGSRERALHLETEWAVTIADLQRLLLFHRPQIVHFAGHGDRDGGIHLIDESGNVRPVSGQTLRDLFRSMSFVRVVVLNACETMVTAEAVCAVVDCVIGMDTMITDPAAVLFAEAFYGALAADTTVREAFDLGVNRLRLEKSAEWSIPRFLAREGFDPATRMGAWKAAPEDDGATVLREVVRFVAACLPGLSPADFEYAVAVLLRKDAATPVDAERLAVAWSEDANGVLAACGVTFSGTHAAGASVGFAGGVGGIEQGWEALEREHPLRFHGYVRVLHGAGLLFGSSEALAGAVARFQADFAAAHPEDYGVDWLTALLTEARRSSEETLPFLLDRFVTLLAAFYSHAILAPVVDALLADLVLRGSPEDAAALVRRLLHTRGFAAFEWLRRLADTGHEPTLIDVRDILRHEFWNANDVYPLLEALAAWLNPHQANARSCRPSGRLALRLVLEYAIASTQGVNRAEHGRWPSSCPLLVIPNPELLTRRMELLASWLFHPALPGVVFGEGSRAADEARRVQAALVAEWVFILDPPELRTAPTDVSPERAFGPDTVAAVLLAEIQLCLGEASTDGSKKALVCCWKEMKRDLSETLRLRRSEQGFDRAELMRRRDLLRGLLTRV
ncbi:MAG TPA: CHAT domain-containing protein [Longimicrobium sp.]